MKFEEALIIIVISLVGISFVVFFAAMFIYGSEQIEMANKLDECVEKNYNGLEYDYNKIISCCRKLDYFRDSYCLEKFKPGYMEDFS